MVDEQNNREREIESEIVKLRQTEFFFNEAKKEQQGIVEQAKDTIANLDKSINFVNTERKAYELYKPFVQETTPIIWEGIKGASETNDNYLKISEAFAKDSKAAASLIKYSAATSESLASGTSSATNTIVHLIIGIPNPRLQEEIKSLKFEPTFTKDCEYIKSELEKLDKNIMLNFDEILKDWLATGSSARKHNHLLTLRSIVFNQILENICPDSSYTKAPWYSKSMEKRKPYCRARFFMQGNTNDHRIPSTNQVFIDRLANSLYDCYYKLSNIGKQGGVEAEIENSFNVTISDFANAFRMRGLFYT